MSNIKCVHEEYQRLSTSLGVDKLDDSKKVLVEELVKQASFLLVELDILKEQIDTYGAIQVNKNGRQKQTEASKHYNRTVTTFSNIIKNLNSGDYLLALAVANTPIVISINKYSKSQIM